jgi:elongation factor P
MTLSIDGTLFTLTFFQHHKPGKGNTVVRSKLKNVLTGAVLEKTWRAGEKIDEVRLEHRPVTYTYTDGQFYHFMDAQTYEDVPISEVVIGEDQLKYLKEGMECEGLVHGEKVIAVDAGKITVITESAASDSEAAARKDLLGSLEDIDFDATERIEIVDAQLEKAYESGKIFAVRR